MSGNRSRRSSQSGERTREVIGDPPFVSGNHIESGKSLKIVDLFAGIGGFHYGIGAAAALKSLKIDPVLVSEIEDSCRQTYERNLRCAAEGDINKILLSSYRNIEADIVTAGFPCQPFSNSGRKLGLKDPRGRFYERIEEIIKHFNSKSFILENVPGMTKNGSGRLYPSRLADEPQLIGSTMKTLEDKLISLRDYHVRWFEVDSSHLGSPQVRKRVYIVGVRRDLSDAGQLTYQSFFPNEFLQHNFTSIVDPAADDDPGLELSPNQARNVRSFMKRAPAYKDGMRRVGQAYLCKGGNVGQAYHAHGMVPTLTKIWARFLPIYFPHDKERLPNVSEKEFVPDFHYYGRGRLRRASVEEAMRLQGFPKSFEPHENPRLAYEHAGNAVNAKVVREIVRHILNLTNGISAATP
jgi:DNA (cytosine-5)-methyltransferase 1